MPQPAPSRRYPLNGLFLVLLPLAASGRSQAPIAPAIAADLPALRALYEHLHRHPELSFAEAKTAERMAAEVRPAGFEVTTGVGGHGIVGLLRNGEGPTVLVRTDLDALPVDEATGLAYASKVRAVSPAGVECGVMHACGHDIHMTVWAGTARLLGSLRDRWSGTVVLVGQPAEERVAGAKAMLADGLYTRWPAPDYALALHVDSSLEAGRVGYTPGPCLANTDTVDITVRGVGGHGAYPHGARDPIVLSAQIVLALQTIVSRETRALDPAVITVGSIHGGSKHNIIPDEVKLQLTVRCYQDEVRARLLASIRRVAEGQARSAGIPEDRLPVVTVNEDEHCPATVNDPELTHRSAAVLRSALGASNVVERPPEMGGEDFCHYARARPGTKSLMLRLGCIPPAVVAAARQPGARPLPTLHSALFAPDPDPTIRTGIHAMTSIVLDLLPRR